jgi:hypothetical protein
MTSIDTSAEAARRAWNAGDHATFIAIIRERNRQLRRSPRVLNICDCDVQRDYDEEADAHGVTTKDLLR